MMESNKKMTSTRIDPATLAQGQVVQIPPFTLQEDGLYLSHLDKKTKEERYTKISEIVFVKETVQNLDTKQVYIILCYWFHNKFHEIVIGMGELIPNELLKLSSKGVDISHENVKHLATFLREQQKLAPHKEIYREVGWHQDSKDQMVFRHHQMIANDPTLSATNDVEGGTYNLEPAGSLEVWKEMIAKEVTGNAMLELLLCMGFSSAIVGYLSKLYGDVDTLLVHLAGNSTQGKTTGALLFASVFGLPSNKNKGLQRTWNGTTNATINMMGGNYGIPVVLDELSMNRSKSLTSELYVLTSGQEKYRLTDEIEQRKPKTWATTILSTGEKSIFEMTNNNAGLHVRAFEFSNVSWTTTAENADAIRRVIQDNYGYAGMAFVSYLLQEGLDIIEDTWEKWQKICLEKLPDSPFRTRLAKKYAIILSAGHLANQSLDLSLDLEGILAFIVKDEAEKVLNRDIGAKAMNYITQLLIQHQTNFRKERTFSNPIDCWGKMFIHSDHIEVAFLKNVLEQQLRFGGFDDPRVVIRDWKEKGWLNTEGDRATKRTKVFEDSEQKEREKALGTKRIPKKAQDTTYNIKLSKEHSAAFIHSHQPFHVEKDPNDFL